MSSSGSNGVCTFDPNCGTDDSRIDIDCSNPSRVIVMGDYTFNSATGEGFVDIESLQMTKSVETSSPMTGSKVPTPSPAGSNGSGTGAPVGGKAAKPTEIPVAVSPTKDPVSAPKPTEPPVSTPNPTEPPVSTPEPTKPQVTASVPTEAPASEEQVDTSPQKDDSTTQDTGGEEGTSETEQVDSGTSITASEGHDFAVEDSQH
jgi:outer membrane biosynthesis protein TonB